MAAATSWNLANRVLSGGVFKTIYIWGPPGIGKTYGAIETAEDPYVITLTEETPASELRGFYMPQGGEFVWNDGPAIKAMREGTRLIFNEVSRSGPDVQSFLFPLLEGKGTCCMTLPTGETVHSEPGFNVVGTDNCSYKDLPEALQDRWDVKLFVNSYSPGGLAGLTPKWRKLAMRSEVAGDDERWISLRGFYSLEKAEAAGYSLEESCEVVFGSEDYQTIYSSIHGHFVSIEQADAEKKGKALPDVAEAATVSEAAEAVEDEALPVVSEADIDAEYNEIFGDEIGVAKEVTDE